MKDRIRRLERAAKEKMISIPQRGDSTVARFPPDASREAYLNVCNRHGAGAQAPPEHPLLAAVRNSSDAWWLQSAYHCEDPDEWVQPVEDLSEP
jgi:hypothetical protein